MELIKIDPQYLAPATSDKFKDAVSELNAALDKFKEAQATELKYQLNYLMENVNKANIKDYGILDPLTNIESLIFQLHPQEK